jgi:hypothetical protein
MAPNGGAPAWPAGTPALVASPATPLVGSLAVLLAGLITW